MARLSNLGKTCLQNRTRSTSLWQGCPRYFCSGAILPRDLSPLGLDCQWVLGFEERQLIPTAKQLSVFLKQVKGHMMRLDELRKFYFTREKGFYG